MPRRSGLHVWEYWTLLETVIADCGEHWLIWFHHTPSACRLVALPPPGREGVLVEACSRHPYEVDGRFFGSAEVAKFVQKVVAQAGNGQRRAPMRDADFEKKYPALWEYLTVTKFDDGTERQTSTLLVFSDGDEFRGCLNDRQEERSCWAVGVSFMGLIVALEERLASGTAEWRTNNRPGSSSGRGGKKK